MEDWEDESPSDDENDVSQIENELYSMFYYHNVSEGIPEDLAKKYEVDSNDFGVTISLKGGCKSNDCDFKNINCEMDENNKELQRHTNGRYVDRGKGCEEIIIDIPDISLNAIDESPDYPTNHYSQFDLLQNKSCFKSKQNESHPEMNLLLPSKTKSPRYFDNINSSLTKTLSSKFSGKKLSLNKSAEDNLEAHVKFSSSTHKLQNCRLYKIDNRSKDKAKVNVPKKMINVKKYEFVDLTKDLSSDQPILTTQSQKKKNKKCNKVNVITISSDSESNELTDDSEFENESILDRDSDSLTSIVLNTSLPSYNADCTVEIDTNYDWRKTSSPKGWTKSMRKFYNKPSKELIQFDYNSFIQDSIDENVEWRICSADRYRFKNKRQIRCIRCNQEGHVKAKCTKVFSCYMCGISGHQAKTCPQKICLKCGSRRNDGFISGCRNCKIEDDSKCNFCGMKGHPSNLCTDAWRSFRYEEEDVRIQSISPKYCCNCAKSGHTVEDCKKQLQFYGTPINRGNKLSGMLTFKDRHKRSFSDLNSFETKPYLPVNTKRNNFKVHPGCQDFRKFRLSKSLLNEKNKKKKNFKRIHMLRKSNKKKKFTPFLSTAI